MYGRWMRGYFGGAVLGVVSLSAHAGPAAYLVGPLGVLSGGLTSRFGGYPYWSMEIGYRLGGR